MKRHIPQRTCISCHKTGSKRELLRIVRTPEGRVVADPTGKKAGRGAYLHKSRECCEEILGTRGRLEHALRMETAVSAEDRAGLQLICGGLPSGVVQAAAPVTQTPTPL